MALAPFISAVRALEKRRPLPTALDSAALRAKEKSFHEQNFVSAQNTMRDMVAALKERTAQIINPQTTQRAERVTEDNPTGATTTGLDLASARAEMKKLYADFGYRAEPGKEGTLQDHASEARLDLVLRTNTQMAQGAGHYEQAHDPDVKDAFPAQELVRFEARKEERDWPGIWRGLGGKIFAGNRMIALKDDLIWGQLGDAEDGLGNDFPPYRFNSGMWVQDVSREEAQQLGLL